jgi:hypothetical protein
VLQRCGMKPRLKYALPIVQMALAIMPLRWQSAIERIQDMPGLLPSYLLVVSINAPLIPVRSLWHYRVPVPWDIGIYIGTIGVFWYWVALNIRSFQRERRLVLFQSVPLRIAANLMLIATGAGIGGYCIWVAATLPAMHRSYPALPWRRSIPAWSCLSIWSLVLMIFFSTDLIHLARRRRIVAARLGSRSSSG